MGKASKAKQENRKPYDHSESSAPKSQERDPYVHSVSLLI